MQGSGASIVAYLLAQAPNTILLASLQVCGICDNGDICPFSRLYICTALVSFLSFKLIVNFLLS
jgi:hypothetical protein